MTRFIVEQGTGNLIPREEFYARQAAAERGPLVIKDIDTFISPIDRKPITSRRQLRDHERAYGVRQVGNDLNGYYETKLGIEVPR